MHARPQTKTRPPSVARRVRFRPRGSPEGQRGLEPSRVAADLHLGDPLDPAVTAVARGHEPQGEAVLGGECFIFNVGGQQEIPGLLQRKPATIAGGGAKHEAARAVRGGPAGPVAASATPVATRTAGSEPRNAQRATLERSTSPAPEPTSAPRWPRALPSRANPGRASQKPSRAPSRWWRRDGGRNSPQRRPSREGARPGRGRRRGVARRATARPAPRPGSSRDPSPARTPAGAGWRR